MDSYETVYFSLILVYRHLFNLYLTHKMIHSNSNNTLIQTQAYVLVLSYVFH